MHKKSVRNKLIKYLLILVNILFCAGRGPAGLLYLAGVSVLGYILSKVLYGIRIRESGNKGIISVCIGIGTVVLLYLYHISGLYYPVGLSFYTLVAAGYCLDILNGRCEPVSSFEDYFLSISFFPLIISGPIEKLQDIASQIKTGENIRIRSDRFVYHFLHILWGLFEKTAVSNIAAILIAEVFDNYEIHSGASIVIATVLFAFQLYADFDGYSNIALGGAGMLGIDIHRNFKQPYLAGSVREFWRRWHISLSNWLKDYVYIPLGGSRKGKARKCANIIITFFVSGMWHGAGANFLVWGLLHGIYQVAEDLIGGLGKERRPADEKTERTEKAEVTERTAPGFDGGIIRIFKTVLTFILVDFAWFFFRADSLSDAFGMMKRFTVNMHTDIPSLIGEFALSELTGIHMAYMAAGLLLIIISDILRYRGIKIYEKYASLNIVIRWIICYALMFAIIISMLSLSKLSMSSFIYGQF